MTAPRYRLDAPDGGYWYCTRCQAADNWAAVLPDDAREPAAYECGCGAARVPAGHVTGRRPADPDAAWLFDALNEWFWRRVEELEDLHCQGAWRQAHALTRWLMEGDGATARS